MESSAIISEDGQFRVRLFRRWRADRPLWLWIMLNPSTADGNKDDATIRRLIGFTERGKGGGMIVENLYSIRATSPKDLAAGGWQIGPDCDNSLATSLIECDGPVIAGWGNHAPPARAYVVTSMVRRTGRETMCLGLTQARAPIHPLYQPNEKELIELRIALEEYDAKGTGMADR